MKYIISLILVISSIQGFGECKNSVELLEKGQIAPCTGLLYSPNADKQAAQDNIDAKHYKDLSDLLYKRQELTTKDISILDQRLHLYMEQSNTLATQLHKKERDSEWQKFIYFGLGVLATGAAFYGVSHLK